MRKEKIYNIHNISSFQLINNTRRFQLFTHLNSEYKYFISKISSSNHFQIAVNKSTSKIEKPLIKNSKKWTIDIDRYLNSSVLNIYPKKAGVKDLFSFLIYKNIYTRSILSMHLLNSNASLLHSCAFKIGEESFIFAGLPGVFKTSILMDAIRHYNAEFLGEENCLIHNSKVYPFPLNIDSISYKIKNYKSENASGKIQKIKLGIHLIKNMNTKGHSLPIAAASEIQNIVYLSKGNDFSIKETHLEKILPLLVDNELQELSIPPTHSLSGISYNFFKESLEKHDPMLLEKFSRKLSKILTLNLNKSKFFLANSPKEYTKPFTDNLISFIRK